MEEVIWKEKGEDDATNKMEFPALKSMTLFDLPMLIDFCSGTGEIEFPQLKKLSLGRLPKLIGFCSGTDEIEFPQLNELRLENLPQLKWLFLNSSNSFSESMENHNATFISLFPHKVALPSLEELQLSYLDNLEGLGHIPISVGSFSKLRKVYVAHCGKLLCVFPSQFLTRLQNLEDLTVENCSLVEKVFELEDSQCEILVDNIEFTQLKILRLHDLQNLVSIFPKVTTTVSTSFGHIQNPGQSLFNEKVAFPSLKELELHGLQNMNEIWCNQLQTGSFNKLFSLYVSDCGSLRNMFSLFMAKHLVHLKRLVIIKCSMMEEVVAKEEDEEEEEEEGRINRTPLPRLEYLKLNDLSELKSFCHISYDWKLPLVKHVTVLNCPKMKTFSPGVICTPKLQRVFVKEQKYEWIEDVEGEDWLWISDLNQTIPHLIEKQQEEKLQKQQHEGENEETCQISEDKDRDEETGETSDDSDGDEETCETSNDSDGDEETGETSDDSDGDDS